MSLPWTMLQQPEHAVIRPSDVPHTSAPQIWLSGFNGLGPEWHPEHLDQNLDQSFLEQCQNVINSRAASTQVFSISLELCMHLQPFLFQKADCS